MLITVSIVMLVAACVDFFMEAAENKYNHWFDLGEATCGPLSECVQPLSRSLDDVWIKFQQ